MIAVQRFRRVVTSLVATAAMLVGLTACTEPVAPGPTVSPSVIASPDRLAPSRARTRATMMAAEHRSGRTLFVAAELANLGDCSASSPCPLNFALDKARSGDTVELATGDYGTYDVQPPKRFAFFAQNVLITSASGRGASFLRMWVSGPHITFRSITVRLVFYVKPGGRGTWLDRSLVDGGGAFLKSDDLTVTDTLFENGRSLDGMQIGGAWNVLVEHNVVRNYNQNGVSGYHADCLQLFDSSDVTIRQNRFGNCYNSAITFSGGSGSGIKTVLIESNFLGGCVTRSSDCDRGTTLDLREPSAVDVTVRSNTLLGGGTRISALRGLVADRNVISYLSTCETPMTNSIVAAWNDGLCSKPRAIDADGNRVGVVAVRDAATQDFRPLSRPSVRIAPWGSMTLAPLDFDGQPTASDVAGAVG